VAEKKLGVSGRHLERARSSGVQTFSALHWSHDTDVAGLRSFFARNDIEFDFGSFLKDGAACVIGMNEHVLAPIVRSNESEAFTCIEEFYCAFGHSCSHFSN